MEVYLITCEATNTVEFGSLVDSLRGPLPFTCTLATGYKWSKLAHFHTQNLPPAAAAPLSVLVSKNVKIK